jgi:hypothetical protein
MSKLHSAFRIPHSALRLDPGYLVVLVICLLAIWPFIGRASLPQETDAELHIFRLLELSYLVRGGEFYPRWAPNFYHGYGYPIFNYYAPLTYYLGLPVELLPRLDAVDGVKTVFILGLLAAGFGMYGFVRDNWGRPAGYVAAAIYVYAPYVQYVDPIARGVLAESFSLGLFPLALWALDRLRRGPTFWRWITAVFLTAALILSHNLLGMFSLAILFAWAAWLMVNGQWSMVNGQQATSHQPPATSHQPPATGNRPPATSHQQPFLFVFAALALGVLLSAFFWLPLFLERNAVNLNTLIGAGDNYDFRTHFLSLGEMLAFSRRLDWGATEPLFVFNLGVAQWLLGGLGLVALLLRRARQSWHAAFFAVSLAFLLFLMLPVSTFLWEAIPLLPYFQFPWRLLGPTAAMLAVLSGVGVAALLEWRNWSEKAKGGITAVAVSLPILLGLPLTQPAPWPDFGEVFPLRMSLIEHNGRWLGTTSTADYVPATVDMIPERKGNVVAGFLTDTPLDRVNRLALPEGATVIGEELSPLHFRYTVDAPDYFWLRLFLFDFPGWTVRLDGEVVETELGRPEGFIVVPVPAGQHTVEVHFQDTPARTLGWLISGLALLATLLIGFRILDLRLTIDDRPSQFTIHNSQFTIPSRFTLIAALSITAVTLLLLQPLNLLHHNSADFRAEPAQQQVWADFGEQIALIGYDISAKTARPGDMVTVTLYWQAQRPLDINYQSFLHVLSPDGVLVAQSDHLNPGDFPTRRWPTDKYVRDVHTFTLPPDLPPGDYAIKTGLWVQTEGWRLPLVDAAGQQIGDAYLLSTLPVR